MSQSTCLADGCERTAIKKGFCGGHYRQQQRGQEIRPLKSQITIEQRFWSKVDKSAPGGCWQWTASTNLDGYGNIKVENKLQRAHRVSWEWAHGKIPESMVVDHRCFNRACVNPEHLRLVDRSQNAQHRMGATKYSVSGVRGVSWHKQRKAWEASAQLNGRKYWGGLHATVGEAEAAARALRAELHTHDDHDEWLKQD